MLYSLFSLALLLSLDSLVVGAGLGAALPGRRRLRLALAFALCDGLASFLGWATGALEWRAALQVGEWLGPVATGVYAVCVLCLAWDSRRLAETAPGGWLVLGLPLCLSLDNLAVGLGADASVASAAVTALAFGTASGCLALLGLWLGAALTARLWPRAEWLGGVVLLVVAVALICKAAIS